MQRQNSFSSAGSGVADSEGGGSTGGDHDQGSGGGERQHGQEEGFSSTELLTQQGSLQEAVFGVLYTLSKERLTEGWRFVVSAMILDYLQLAVFFIGNNFPWNFNFYAWPIKVLKLAVSFFFELFYISTLGIFVIALDCTYYNPVKVNELLAMGMAYFLAVANSELDPLSEELSSQAHNRYAQGLGIACIIMMTYLCYNYVRYMPFQTAWINGVQASFFASLSWASFLIVLMAFFFQSSDKRVFTILVWVGLLWVLPLVWGMVYLRVRHAHKVALMYRMALKPGCEPVIHKFVDELEVEVVARCGRIRDKWGDLMPIWVDTAEAVYKAGLAQFPNSAYLNIAYSSFLIHQRGAMQVGAGLLEVARKLEPSMGERFMIFVRDREEKQRSGSGADGSSHDLLSYVEFQNNFKALLDVHRQALKANRNFWRQLVRKDVAFSDLTKAFATMEGAEKRADSTFKMVLDRYPNSPKLLHAYALYLESVKSNPSRAARYRSEAARLEKATPQGTHNLALGDSAEGGGEAGESVNRSVGAMVDDAIDAVVVINDVGIMQFVNKKALEMFGYKLGQLEGKNVSALMGPPFSTHHNQYLQRLKKTGTATRVGKAPFPTVALHAHGFSFPINEENDSALLWVNLAGHMLALNKGFGDLSGYAAADLHGEFVGSIGADDGLGQEFKHISDLLKDWQYKAIELGTTKHTFQVSLKHKYGAAFAVSGSASFAGTENVRLIVLRLKLDEHAEKLGLLSVNPAGQVVYTNAALENMLGYEPGKLPPCLSAAYFLLASALQPAAQLPTHLCRRPSAAPRGRLTDLGDMLAGFLISKRKSIRDLAPFSCRTGRIVYLLGRNNKQIPVRLQVVQVQQAGTMRCLTATVTELEVPEADGWGGGTVRDVFNSSKRMQLLVHADGRVLALKADAATALAGFGQDVKDLCGKDISEVVQDFNKPAGVFRDWPPVPQLLSRLSHQTSKMHAAGGAASFRVGVIPSAAAAQLDQGLKKTALALSGTLPCRMVVLPLVDEGALSEQDISDGGQLHVVELRQDDLVEVNMEIDSELRVKAAAGRAAGTLRVEDFLGVKRSQLKRVDHQAVGDKQEMVALHADGSRMLVLVQGADKHGDGTRISAVTASSQPVSPKAKPAEGRSEHSLDDDGTSYNEGNSLEEPQLMIVFILVEAGGLIPLCCLALYLLLDFVNRARLRLFNVFLAVPRPVVMQLATREVQVSQDEEEGDDEDGETWLRASGERQQQQQDGTGSGAAADKGVGYSLTATKRRLVANLVGSSLLHYWLGAAFPMIQVYLQGILYGDAKLGLDGALRLNNQHEQLWFGQGCLNANTTKCLRPGDPLYEDTNNGLNHLMNQFLLHAAQLWVTQPAVSVSLNTPAFEFLWAVDRDGEVLEDGLETNTRNFVSDGRNRITLVVVLQVLTMVLSVGMVVYFYFFSLVPFLLHSKKESRRVAELMSQLPADMDVESLVLSSTNQEEEVPIVSPPTAGNDVSTKFNKSYQEKMRHHQSERESDLEDPTLWAKHRSPRRVSFA
ncbi:hypothetical protein N2152v2_003766 [Parachlorella kessleri]